MAAFGHMLVLFGGGCGEQWDSKFSDVYVFDTTTNVSYSFLYYHLLLYFIIINLFIYCCYCCLMMGRNG